MTEERLVDHDRRLIRIETLIALAQGRRLPPVERIEGAGPTEGPAV